MLNAFKKYSKNKLLRNTYFLLFIIVMFGLFLRLIFFSGVDFSDSLAYAKTANDLDKGIDLDLLPTASTRLGVIYSTAFSYSLFGINDFSSVLFVLLSSLGSIILIFYFGKLLFNEKVGLMAALLLSFFPLDVVYSTKLLSDIPSAFFMALGVYIFLYFERKKKLNRLGYFFSGIFIGIGYLIRESALLIALFFIIYILYKKRIKKRYFLVPLGVLIVFLVETLLFMSLTGDPFSRLHASQGYNAEAVSNIYNYFGRLDFPTGLFHYPWLIFTNGLLLYFYIFIFIAVGYSLIYKKKETYYMLFWFIALLAYLSYGSSSFSQYIPFKAADRYLAIVSIPGILLFALFLTEKNKIIKRVIAPLVLIILLLTSLGTVSLREDRNLLGDLREAHAYLGELDNTIYIDQRSILALDYISEYDNEFVLREYPAKLNRIKDSYVVINKRMIRSLRAANPNLELPREVDNPPSRWKIVKEIGNKEEDKIVIYYVMP